jgi:hypothetical protein
MWELQLRCASLPRAVLCCLSAVTTDDSEVSPLDDTTKQALKDNMTAI